MKFSLLSLLSLLFLGSGALSAQTLPPLPNSTPPEGDPDKCYALCYMPQKWETVTEDVQTYSGGSSLVVATPQYETITERVMIKPASYRMVEVPATYETVEERIEIAPAYTEYSIEAAKFETVTERVMIAEGSESFRMLPPKFSAVTNANMYYGTVGPDGTFTSTDYGNILDPTSAQGTSGSNAPFDPTNPNSLINDPNSPFNAAPSTYGTSGDAALLDPNNPDSPFSQAYVDANGIDRAMERANELLSTIGVGAIAPYIETESRVEIDRIVRPTRTESDRIEIQAAYMTYEQMPTPCDDGKGDCISWCAVEVPAQYQTVTRTVAEACPAGYSVAALEQGGDEYCVRLTYTPAVYGARQVMTAGPSYEMRSSDARFKDISVQRMVSPAKVVERQVPAKYDTYTKRVQTRAAYTKYELVPAEYKTVTRRVRRGLKGVDYITTGGVFMAGPNQYDGSTTPSGTAGELPIMLNPAAGYPVSGTTLPIRVGSGPDRAGNIDAAGYGTVADLNGLPAGMPSNYYTAGCPSGYSFDPRDGLCKATSNRSATSTAVTRRVANGEGNFSEWQEVLCPNKVSNVSIRDLQRALNQAGYNVGTADGIMGSKTKAALAKYQKDNGLPIGGMNMATMRKLGLR